MKNKKALMGLAAILVLVIHFYIPFSRNVWEMTLYKASFIGVDIFFFVSACSLGKRKIENYWSYLWSRIQAVYLPFVFFAIVAALYSGWSAGRFLRVISGVEFFKKGGGAFLWFDTGILLVYAVTPALVSLKQRFGLWFLPAALAAWAAVTAAAEYGFGYTTLHILLNRLPVFLLGLYYPEMKAQWKDSTMKLVTAACLLAGGYLVYRYCGIRRINVPLRDLYYVAAIPFLVGLVCLVDALPYRFPVLSFLGKYTLEVYALQMIFGFKLEERLLKLLGNNFLAFLLTCLCLFAGAWLLGTGKQQLKTVCKNKKTN